jgi:hypothetical protein
MAINCADDPDRPTAEQITKNLAGLRAQYEQASPVFGRYRLTEVLMCYGRPGARTTSGWEGRARRSLAGPGVWTGTGS